MQPFAGKGGKGEFGFNFDAGNDQVILASKSNPAEASPTAGIEAVSRIGHDDAGFDREPIWNGRRPLGLAASNGRP